MGLNKSRPIYEKLRIDPLGRAHLIVTDLPALPEAIAAEFSNTENWVVARSAPGIAASLTGSRAFRAVADLLTQLSHFLARAPVGLRLYAAGTEAFLWDVNNIAGAAGLGPDEVFLFHAGSLRRRVYCTHCKTINDDVTTNVITCSGCGASLFVRDHFSRRLAAFMGVMIDAEIPGELPPVERLYQ